MKMSPRESHTKPHTCPNPNHPKKGASIKVAPIQDLTAIHSIKHLLSNNPRDFCLFTFGINTAYRASELVSIEVGQVAHLTQGGRLAIKQPKNQKYRRTVLNEAVIHAVQQWLQIHPDPRSGSPLFLSQKTGEALKSNTLTRMVKTWCKAIGLQGNYGSHTLRKTWGYHQRVTFHQPTAIIRSAYGHASESQTLDYLCIETEEVEALYAGVL